MKAFIIIIFICFHLGVSCQEFVCDGSFYVIIFNESEGQTKLYNISQKSGVFDFSQVQLSGSRRLFGLSYNTKDLHLWAIDAEQFELVRINSLGQIETMGSIENMDQELYYSSGMISPDGNTYYFIGYNESEDRAQKFFEIDLTVLPFHAEYDDISASGRSRILDMAVDPVFGAVYGYNNVNGTIVQFGIDGQIATISQSRRDEQSIEALFFDRDANMYGYTRKGELYVIDKVEGNLQFLQRGPQGSLVDGCACPYTYSFTKDIIQRTIIPCEPFEVTYSFRNNLGISQTGIKLRDTFPAGFQILDVKSSVPYTPGNAGLSDNVLALNNMIYLMGGNTIRVVVQPSSSFHGTFSSQARQDTFPKAFSEVLLSDDPQTESSVDATAAEIVMNVNEALDNYVKFSCDGLSATISAPVNAEEYLWNNGSTESAIEVFTPGTYRLQIENDCFFYRDSVVLDVFPGAQRVDLGEDRNISVGDSVRLTANLDAGNISSVLWTLDGSASDCINCSEIWLYPESDISVAVEVEDDNGCILNDEVFISVEYLRNMYAPNVFSPNGDGINDVFFISSAVPGTMDLSIYNRWGNLVYKNRTALLSDISSGWDGYMDGQLLSSGPYLWVAKIEFINGQQETLSGDFILIGR